jgi:hypothetical protein
LTKAFKVGVCNIISKAALQLSWVSFNSSELAILNRAIHKAIPQPQKVLADGHNFLSE